MEKEAAVQEKLSVAAQLSSVQANIEALTEQRSSLSSKVISCAMCRCDSAPDVQQNMISLDEWNGLASSGLTRAISCRLIL